MFPKDNVKWMVMSEGNEKLDLYRKVEPSFLNLFLSRSDTGNAAV